MIASLFTIYLLAVVAAFTFAQINIFSGNRQGRLEYGYREHLFVCGQKNNTLSIFEDGVTTFSLLLFRRDMSN